MRPAARTEHTGVGDTTCLWAPPRKGGQASGRLRPGRFNQAHKPSHHMEERPQQMTWLHQIIAAHPELTPNQVMELVRRQEQSFSDEG